MASYRRLPRVDANPRKRRRHGDGVRFGADAEPMPGRGPRAREALALASLPRDLRSAARKRARRARAAARSGPQPAVGLHEALAKISRLAHERFEDGGAADAPFRHLI